jgi:Ricin-type beta-trefoil lectin domain-like
MKAKRASIGIRGARIRSSIAVGLSLAMAAILFQPSLAAAARMPSLQLGHASVVNDSGPVRVSWGTSGQCLDGVTTNPKAYGQRVYLHSCSSSATQQWRETLEDCNAGVTDQCAELANVATNLCLDVYQASGANGTHAVLWICSAGDPADLFKINPAPGTNGSPYWTVWAANIGTCLDDPGASTKPGTPVQFYQCNETAAQIWKAPGWVGLGA